MLKQNFMLRMDRICPDIQQYKNILVDLKQQDLDAYKYGPK